MKYIIKYITVFIVTVFLLFSLLVITAKIPRQAIVENIKKTTDYFHNERCFLEVKQTKKDKYYTYLHIYADAMLLNIIYYIDSDNPVQSVMESKYYSPDNAKRITYNFNEMIEENQQANMQYMRYWHGSMSIVRPLLVFFDINQIYIINAIVFSIGTIILLILLIKTKIKELVISYIIGLIMCTIIFVPFCLEYFWTFLVMTIVSIIAIILNKNRKNLNILFMLSGMITCYLDFLSTEIITLLIPMIFILVIRYKQENLTFKEGIKLFVILSIFWGIGYVGMWLTKWLLASIILNVNALDYVINDIRLRVDGTGNEMITIIQRVKNLKLRAVNKNLVTLYPMDFILGRKLLPVFIASIAIVEIIFIRKKDLKKLWFSGLLLVIAAIPYLRYILLASHAFTHYFFTFRSQIITIMAIILSIIYSIDTDTAKKEIRIGRSAKK